MGPGGWQFRRVKPTSLVELQHLVVPTRSKSQHAQGEQSPMRDWSHEDDLAMPKRRLHLPTSRMTKLVKVGTTLDMSINQFTLFDIHVTFLTI